MTSSDLTPFQYTVMLRTSVLDILSNIEPDSWMGKFRRKTYEIELKRLEDELKEFPEYKAVFGSQEQKEETVS
jgi:hypothetical protein